MHCNTIATLGRVHGEQLFESDPLQGLLAGGHRDADQEIIRKKSTRTRSCFISQSGYYSAMRLETRLRPWKTSLYPEGSFVWDSETGEIGGDLADAVQSNVERACQAGTIAAGPQFAVDYRITDPLHRPDEMGAVLQFMEFELPPELAAAYRPDFPDPLAGMSPAERRQTQL